MNRSSKWLQLGLVSLALAGLTGAGCSTGKSEDPKTTPKSTGSQRTPVPLQEYVGQAFRIAPPQGQGWEVADEKTNRVVYVTRDRRSRTFEISVAAWEEPWPIETPEEFRRFAEARHTMVRDPDAPRVRDYKFVPVTDFGPLCIRWEVEGAPLPGGWIVHVFGYEIRHPTRPDYFVRAMFRQVGPNAVWEEERLAEARAVFSSLKLQ